MALEVCPNCGNLVESLDEVSGFCIECTECGGLLHKTPTPITKKQRLELWYSQNGATIEALMVSSNLTAQVAIREIALQVKARCQCCGDVIPHGTNGRHFFCNKKDKCRKARRYYKYLIYEKGKSKDDAFKQTIEKFVTSVTNG